MKTQLYTLEKQITNIQSNLSENVDQSKIDGIKKLIQEELFNKLDDMAENLRDEHEKYLENLIKKELKGLDKKWLGLIWQQYFKLSNLGEKELENLKNVVDDFEKQDSNNLNENQNLWEKINGVS